MTHQATDFSELPYRPCAGIVLINKDGLVFAGRRLDSKSAAADAWQMPQGGIDEGEDPEAAAWREMLEEIGTDKARLSGVTENWISYDLPDHLLGKVWKGRYRGQQQKWFAFHFEGNDADINIETEDPEFSTWQWMKAEELLACTVTFKHSVYEQVFEAFGDFLT